MGSPPTKCSEFIKDSFSHTHTIFFYALEVDITELLYLCLEENMSPEDIQGMASLGLGPRPVL